MLDARYGVHGVAVALVRHDGHCGVERVSRRGAGNTEQAAHKRTHRHHTQAHAPGIVCTGPFAGQISITDGWYSPGWLQMLPYFWISVFTLTPL